MLNHNYMTLTEVRCQIMALHIALANTNAQTYRFAASIVKKHLTAEDITQDMLQSVMTSRNTKRLRVMLRKGVSVAVVNSLLNYANKKRDKRMMHVLMQFIINERPIKRQCLPHYQT